MLDAADGNAAGGPPAASGKPKGETNARQTKRGSTGGGRSGRGARHRLGRECGPPGSPAGGEKPAVAKAREQAKLMHGIYASTLDAMHHYYFRTDRAVLPARRWRTCSPTWKARQRSRRAGSP